MKAIIDGTDDLGLMAKQGGGKARNLARLQQAGMPVPAWFCVGGQAFEAFLAARGPDGSSLQSRLDGLLTAQRQGHTTLRALADGIEAEFLAAALPQSVSGSIAAALQARGWGDRQLAVRSSGLDEDSADHSFAGQFSSYLFQRGQGQLENALKRCWASAYSERALSYRRERGLPTAGLMMGVVIQEMLEADAAGVAFSRHPIRVLERDTVLISSVWGLGEGLVDGTLDADHFEVSRSSGEVKTHAVQKDKAVRRSPGGGTELVDLPPARGAEASLTEAQAQSIAGICVQLEAALGGPQDIEWVLEGGNIHLVQARPVTNLPPDAFYDRKVNGGAPILWDNSNIVESYSGVTSPLTFSFASRAYNLVYIQFCQVMGVPADLINRQAGMFRNMLGLVRGRIYYNLANWYQLVLMLPGSATNKGFMETMMGVKQQVKPQFQGIFEFVNSAPRYSATDKLVLTAKTVVRFIQIDRIVSSFMGEFNAIYQEARRRNYREMSLTELRSEYEHLDREFLSRWKAPIINDYLCMIFFGILKKLVEKWLGEKDGKGTLQNDLLCGEGGLESTEPTKRLMAIASHVDLRADPAFREWVMNAEPAAVWDGLRAGRDPQVLAMFESFLDAYGFRCVDELKLESHDLHSNPAFVVGLVTGYIRTKSYDIERIAVREKEIRAQAETRAKQRVRGLKQAVFFWILRQARKAVKNRENLRFARTKVFGVCRNLFRAFGLRLEQLGALHDREDVFYLTVDEIIAYVEGRSLDLDLASIATRRKSQFAEFEASPPPDRMITEGAAAASFRYPAVLDESDLLRGEFKSDDPNVFLGTPCCPGQVTGIVRVVKSMEDAQGINGEILVTSRTDPGWVPLYPSCSGLLIERGSLLSHSAVVARELGLPTIVGISGGLMAKLKTGQRVFMDAGKGEVRILQEDGGNA